MERYEAALDRGDPASLAEIYESWSAAKQTRLAEYFTETVSEYNVEFSGLTIREETPDTALIGFVRRDRFTDTFTGIRVEREISLKRKLRRAAGKWKLTSP